MHHESRVRFYPTEVSSISREPSDVELFVLNSFHRHLRDCQQCQWATEPLCPLFHRIAWTLVERFEMKRDGRVYSARAQTMYNERVEVPSTLEVATVYLATYRDWRYGQLQKKGISRLVERS